MTRAQLLKLAHSLGVTDIEIGRLGNTYEVAAYTPKGKIWIDTGCHSLIEDWFTDPAGCRAAAAERMEIGIENCTLSDCGYCNPEEDDQ